LTDKSCVTLVGHMTALSVKNELDDLIWMKDMMIVFDLF
jgi:hypothetical protein